MRAHDLAKQLLAMDDREVHVARGDGQFEAPEVALVEVYLLPRGVVPATDAAGNNCGKCGYPTVRWRPCSRCGHANKRPSPRLVTVIL